MKNILFIPVGGTICTSLNENGSLSVTPESGNVLKTNFEKSDSKFANQVNIDVKDNLFILSENMTVESWNKIIKAYLTHIKTKDYCGVVIAHGTDTLAYSASLFSMLLAGTDIPVFFVSANARPNSPKSNGNENFKCAIECICNEIEPNIYVVYKNISDSRMYLHLASRLEQCQNYSEDFYSKGMIEITDIPDALKKIKRLYPTKTQTQLIKLFENKKLSDCILMIEPYVGLNYANIKYENYKAILHTCFHSGTVCSLKNIDHSVLCMIESCDKLNCPTNIYFSPMSFEGEIYDSIDNLKNKNIFALNGFTKELTYCKLIIAYSLFENTNDIIKFIKSELNYENVFNCYTT